MFKNITATQKDDVLKYGFNASAFLAASAFIWSMMAQADYDDVRHDIQSRPSEFCQSLIEEKKPEGDAQQHMSVCLRSVESLPAQSESSKTLGAVAKGFGTAAAGLASFWIGFRRENNIDGNRTNEPD